jgi:type IV pilus assembly protein PilW
VIELGIDNVGDGGVVDYTKAVDFGVGNVKNTARHRGDGAPDSFIRCDTACNAVPLADVADPKVGALLNVVAAKVNLLVRSNSATPNYIDTKSYTLGNTGVTLGPYNDGFKRHVYSTTVRLNNISSRRETP